MWGMYREMRMENGVVASYTKQNTNKQTNTMGWR
jgi:hypothetical protein